MEPGTVSDRAPIEQPELARLRELGRQLRVDSIRLADDAGSGHPTSSMSAADLMAVLVSRHLRLDPTRPDAIGNDRLLFSKGHASPLLYATLSALGVLTEEQLAGYRRAGSLLEGHPVPSIPGVPAATGSLGLGLPIGVGLALTACRFERTQARTWVLCGDSEMTEGSMWEAIEYAGWMELGNLVAIVDVNRLGQTGPTRYGWDLEVYRRRFEAAGWRARTVDGHDIEAIDEAYAALDDRHPTAVIAETRKGSGATETDDELGKHGKPLDDPEAAIAELGGRRSITVEPLPASPVPPPVEHHRYTAVAGATTAADRSVILPTWEPGTSVATRDAFGAAAAALVGGLDHLVALDAEVGDSTRLDAVAEVRPDRYLQLHIAEQLQFSVAVGLQASGWRPVVSTFGAFCTRAHDVLRMAAISRADLCVVGSHAGASIGPDGPSQMALEDLAMLRALHGSTVLSPCDANQCAALLQAMIGLPGISYLRTTREDTPVIYRPGATFSIGGSHVLRQAPDDTCTVVATGVTVHEALAAADELAAGGTSVGVIDAYSVKPIDGHTLVRAARATGRLVVVEDHRPEGGLGEAVLAALGPTGVPVTVSHLAVRSMPGSADAAEQRRLAGIDRQAIRMAVEAAIDDPVGSGRAVEQPGR